MAIETFTHNGKYIEIVADDSGICESPRECCNLGTFWTQERRSYSPDALEVSGNIFQSVSSLFGGIAEAESNAKALDRSCIWLPVWKYEHSGVMYRAAESNPFSCRWDSGQVGYIWVRKETVRAEYGVKRITPATRAKVLDVLKAEVETYSQWANGETYGFKIYDQEDGDELDSCWGFIGLDHVTESAKEAA